jgi:DNA-binding transcriptional LysR family regulator
LGAQLLQRTTRSVRLTEEGAAFLARCRQILSDLRDAEQQVIGARSEPHGELIVTAPVVFGRMHVVPVIATLLGRHPQLVIRLLLLDRTVNLVEEGIDVAVRIGELPDSSFRAVKVSEVREVLVASPSYLEKHGAPASPADLRGHQLILFTSLNAGDDWRFGPDEGQVVRVRPRLEVNSADAAITAAQAGLGITRVLSYQVSAAVASGRLRTVLGAFARPPVPVSVLMPPARHDSVNVRSFIQGMKDYLAEGRRGSRLDLPELAS